MFAKAAASLCDSMTAGTLSAVSSVSVTAPGVPKADVAVGEMAEQGEGLTYTVGCACSSNGPGGGAIANANVQGVALKTLMAMMGA